MSSVWEGIIWSVERLKRTKSWREGKFPFHLFELGHWFSLAQDWNYTSNSSSSQAFTLRLELHRQLALLGIQLLRADCGTSHQMSQLLKQTNKQIIVIIDKNIFYTRNSFFTITNLPSYSHFDLVTCFIIL